PSRSSSASPVIGSQGRRYRLRPGFPIPLSIRTCRFPAYGLPTAVWTWLRRLRVSDGAHELVQALVVEPGSMPTVGLARPQVAAPLLDEQAAEPPRHVTVHGDELVGSVAGAE